MEPMKRRDVLAGLAATPVLLTVHPTGASAAPPAGDGGTRYFPWPLIQPGTHITWPPGAVALSPSGATRASLAGLTTVPARGGPSQHVYLTGFGKGVCSYTITTPGRRPVRVTWDAGRWPYLRVWGEYGQRIHAPYWGQYFGLIITPVTHPARTKATRS